MARLARVILPGLPYLVTQRGVGGRRVFFSEADYRCYRDMLAGKAREAGVLVLAWCLMPNHVHLILSPEDEVGLRRALAGAHRRYAGLIRARRNRPGTFWQGRYAAVAMDEDHLKAAYRYVVRNPVRARLVNHARDWPWSSARALLGEGEDPLTDLASAHRRIADFGAFLAAGEDPGAAARLRGGESVGRPIGSEAFLTSLEAQTGRRLRVLPRGPKPKAKEGFVAAAANASKVQPWRVGATKN